MVQRLTYRRCHSYATKSNQHRVIKTPGGKLVYQTTKKRASGPKCPVTCKRIQGVHLFDFVLARLNFNCSRLFISSSKNNNSDEQQQEVTRREVILRNSGLAVIGAIFHFSGTKPNYLDVQKNPPSLALCPATNKCISTSENISDLVHYAPPWNYNPLEGRGSKKPVSKEVAMEELLEVINSTKPDNYTPRVVEKKDDYIRVEYESPILGFVDDVEFWFPPGKKPLVQYRSASRIGLSFDANRKRVKALRLALEKKGWASENDF